MTGTAVHAGARDPDRQSGEPELSVAIAHDWLTTYGGAERCLAELAQAFPRAELLTTLSRTAAMPPVLSQARTSFLQRLPGAVNRHELLLPLMPFAWHLLRPGDVDAVVSSSHACAKAVRVAAGVPHVCYCHTPMRYAWEFPLEAGRFPPQLQVPTRAAMAWFRRWDRRTAAGVTHFVANSTAVASRIRRAYGRAARVVHPPVQTDFFTPGTERGDHFLYVGRLVAYKRADLLVDVFAQVPYPLIVIGKGPLLRRLRARATPNVTFVDHVTDEQLRELYRTARALVLPGEEDFGIAMAEAQACGTPVIALARGGALDIVTHKETGWLLENADRTALRRAVLRAARVPLDPQLIRGGAERFAAPRFREQMRQIVQDAVSTSGRPIGSGYRGSTFGRAQ